MDPRRAIGTAAASVDLVNQRGDVRICNSAPRGRSLLPCVVASWGHAKPLTHERDRERRLLRVDELEYIQRAHRPRSPSLTLLCQAAPLSSSAVTRIGGWLYAP